MSLKSNKKYDVGVLGWWYGKNYGSILTYYGLNRAIESLGFSVLMVHEPTGYNGYRVTWPDDILSMQFARRAGYNYTQQVHYSQLPALNDEVDTFVVGSDQLWNPLIGRVNDDLFLNFVSPENRRVAYATSFGNRGTAKFKPEFIARHSPNLQQFSAISVREKYAVNTARDVFGVHADLVVDPVFLLPREHYQTLAHQASATVSGDYLAVFFLDPTPEKVAVAEAIADKVGLKRIVVIPNPDGGRKLVSQLFQGDRFEVLESDSPENFLKAYSGSSYVVTDSFHGTAFAAIFEKPFSSIYNTHRGADRFKNLLSSLGFGESRRVFETDDAQKLSDNPHVSREIDFSGANRYIETERKASLRWLKAAVSGKTEASGLLDSIKALVPSRDRAVLQGLAEVTERPAFTSINDAWRVSMQRNTTELTVGPGGSVRGNQVWCDLPFELNAQSAYRLTIKWLVRTTGGAVNLHIRNSETGKFRVIGTVPVRGRTNKQRTDSVDFLVPTEGFNQFMLGAVHFSGAQAGAEISSIAVQEISASSIAVPSKKGPTHAEKALEMALQDHERFASAHAKSASSRAVGAARARLMFHAHAVEKGLSRTDFRPGFGKIAVPNLAKEMNGWLAAGRDPNDQFFRSGASVMRTYFQHHRTMNFDVSEFHNLFNPSVQKLIAEADTLQGGVLAADADRETPVRAGTNKSFIDVVYGRRSVREFTADPVRDEDIRAAVQIAMQAPSVCNRQAARVHLFEDPKAIKAALDIQGGFGGYQMPPRLLLVTSDLTAFLFAAERNQPFIDGGLFMMNLLLGLQQMGLGSCSLNTAMNAERENAIRKILGIPDTEVFIAFVATGHYDGSILTPQSRRIPVDEVLVLHNGRS